MRKKSKSLEKGDSVKNSFELLSKEVKGVLTSLGYENGTKLQNEVIPELISKEDNIFCYSSKSSGKMLSFILPIINKIKSNEDNKNEINHKYIIVSCIKSRSEEIYLLSKELLNDVKGEKIIISCGGSNQKKEIKKLSKNDNEIQLIIFSPQKLLEYLNLINNKDEYTIVFDKFDTLIKNNYENEIKKILEYFKDERHKFIFFSEDKNDIDEFENYEYIKNTSRNFRKIIIKVNNENKKEEEEVKTGKNKGYIIISQEKKFLFLLSFLRKNLLKKIVVVFCTQKQAEFYKELLDQYKIKTDLITNDIKNCKSTLLKFNKNDNGVLLCKDLSNLKLTDNIDWTLYYDTPADLDFILNNNLKTKVFIMIMEHEKGFVDKNLICFNFSQGQIDKDQQKVERIVNTKEHSLFISSFEAYKSFLYDYKLRKNKIAFDFSKIDVKKLCKSYGLVNPPFINFSSIDSYKEDVKNKKSLHMFPNELEKIYGKKEDK